MNHILNVKKWKNPFRFFIHFCFCLKLVRNIAKVLSQMTTYIKTTGHFETPWNSKLTMWVDPCNAISDKRAQLVLSLDMEILNFDLKSLERLFDKVRVYLVQFKYCSDDSKFRVCHDVISRHSAVIQRKSNPDDDLNTVGLDVLSRPSDFAYSSTVSVRFRVYVPKSLFSDSYSDMLTDAMARVLKNDRIIFF